MSDKLMPLQNKSSAQQIKFVKSEAKRLRRSNHKEHSHKYYLNYAARKLGYKSYDHLYEKFQADAREWRELGKAECSSRHFDGRRKYYYVTMHSFFEYSYFSHWTAWDDQGYELRAPSLMNPAWVIKLVRESLCEPLYIIHNEDECSRWALFWHGAALVDHDVITKRYVNFLESSRSYAHPRLRESIFEE